MAELAREHGVSEATLYGWKSKYGGMEVGEAQRLMPAGFAIWPMLGRRFLTGIRSTTASDRTVAWAIARPTSLPKR